MFDIERPFGSITPLWWRVPSWLAISAFCVIRADGLGPRIATGVLMVGGAVLLQFVTSENRTVRMMVVLVTTALGLAACYTAPDGIAEILVVVTASRAPAAFDGRVLRGYVVLTSIGFGVTIAIITGSYPALLVGLSIPFLIQRSVEHRDLVRERDRAQALLAEVQRGRESEAQAAALQERGRIAREMHDVLAHSLAGLSVQLQAIRALAARDGVGPAVLEPLDRAALLAQDGLAEARAAVSTLRDPVGLDVDALPALVQRHPGDARLRSEGETGRLGAGAGHAVYRAVQESLTNAARYAPGSAVRVDLHWEATRLWVTVDDDGPAPGRDSIDAAGTGLGLAGMAERITGVSGTLHAGPRPDGAGWRVEICVPVVTADAVR